MLEPEHLPRGFSLQRRTNRARSLIPDADAPLLVPHWFHAIDNPLVDPVSIRTAKLSSPKKMPKSPSAPKSKATAWLPFSKRDSNALEKAYQNNDVRAKVSVNEDYLFEVDITERILYPVYWEGPTFEVRRATWFMQADSSKWTPCEETLAEQIELGYYKYKPYANDTVEDSANQNSSSVSKTGKQPGISESKGEESPTATVEENKLEATLEKQPVEKQWNLLGPYLGQYIIYTGLHTAWLLSNRTSSKLAKSIITRLTNKQNLGGTRIIRGYPEVENQKKAKPVAPASPKVDSKAKEESENKEGEEDEIQSQEIEEYENMNSEEEVRKIDHIIFVLHGIGQKMSEKTGHSFVQDVSTLRKTIKSVYPTAIAATKTPHHINGIQTLPILWRQDIMFGMASDSEEGAEADLGILEPDDGCPTLEELTLEGVPNIRNVVSDVLMDIPLYMTPKYRDQMTLVIAKEVNRVYKLFIQRNPDFLESGRVSIFGHSLGSMLAFDMLTMQPMSPQENQITKPGDIAANEKKKIQLAFPVQNFFAVGSPLAVILLLRGYKIGSRKSLGSQLYPSFTEYSSTPSQHISHCYPAVDNLYNIFHKSDPVAYRLEPLIARHYSSKLKPEPIPYIKGGLKGVIDAGFNVGSGIANRAGAMYESFKIGLTTNLFMRGLGLSRQQIYQDMHPSSDTEEEPLSNSTEIPPSGSHRARSNSDPASQTSSIKSTTRKAPPTPLPSAAPYSQGARKLRLLNSSGRVDFCLQEGLLENPYFNAFSAHLQYWQDVDVAAFMVREIYRNQLS
ncbi:DDHD domain-containing protein [Spinellus fusiger]|nr:DDHD domain-containing protein [Spinellus fusiger]